MGDSVRFEVRVKPGAKGSSVGGTWGEGRALNVSVHERAVDSRANTAVVELLATVLKVKKHQLSIVSGHVHRTKLIEVVNPPEGIAERLEWWRNRK